MSTRGLFALMAGQYGVASCAQARQAGVSRAVERRLIAEGALVQPMRGVIAAGGVQPTFASKVMAASLCHGVVALSHGAAARLHRLEGFADHPDIDVIATRNSRLRLSPPIVVHRTRGPVEEHVVYVGPVAVTSIPLTLLLLAVAVPERMLVSAVMGALRRGVPATSLRNVAETWRHAGRLGPGELIDALDLLEGRLTSP